MPDRPEQAGRSDPDPGGTYPGGRDGDEEKDEEEGPAFEDPDGPAPPRSATAVGPLRG